VSTESPAGYLLKRAQAGLHDAMAAVLADHALTVAQYAVLAAVATEPGLSNADLARKSFVTPQTMNQLLRDLEDRGLVARSQHPQHGRVLQTRPTPAGLRTAQAATDDVNGIEERMLSALTPTQRKRFAEALTSCITALTVRKRPGIAPRS
jgi:DNA-binding MarR family transcriptional regulator